MEPHETIWKFELPLEDITAVTYEEVVAVMPRGARVLHVAEQGAAGLAIGGRLACGPSWTHEPRSASGASSSAAPVGSYAIGSRGDTSAPPFARAAFACGTCSNQRTRSSGRQDWDSVDRR